MFEQSSSRRASYDRTAEHIWRCRTVRSTALIDLDSFKILTRRTLNETQGLEFPLKAEFVTQLISARQIISGMT